jgi:peptide deformylase
LRQIAHIGHPALREKAGPVAPVNSPEIRRLVDDMVETMTATDGVGLAAPQIMVPLRLFIVACPLDSGLPDPPETKPVAIINPEIIAHSTEVVKDWEGCLSVPGIRGLVPRFRSVTLRYAGTDGSRQEREFVDFMARVCQHEYDHLEGILYLDRLESVKDIISDAYYRELMARE